MVRHRTEVQLGDDVDEDGCQQDFPRYTGGELQSKAVDEMDKVKKRKK